MLKNTSNVYFIKIFQNRLKPRVIPMITQCPFPSDIHFFMILYFFILSIFINNMRLIFRLSVFDLQFKYIYHMKHRNVWKKRDKHGNKMCQKIEKLRE